MKYFGFLLVLLSASTRIASADSAWGAPTSFAINGQKLGDQLLTVGSPYVSLVAAYALSDGYHVSDLRIYRGHDCSLTNPRATATWCSDDRCEVGKFHEFDITFESLASKRPLFHIFTTERRTTDFSVELNVRNPHGAIESRCFNQRVQINPCDAVVSVEQGNEPHASFDIEIVDARSGAPVDGVDVQVTGGPPDIIRPAPGVVRVRSIPSRKFHLLFSRTPNQRFAAGPFENQSQKKGIKMLKVALCPID